ncbi:MAG: fibronectin type III domain-containing protein [Desulfohalobiaceae bacterium]
MNSKCCMHPSYPPRDLPRFALRAIILTAFVLLSVCLASPVQGARVTLEWDQCSHSDVEGYRIYYGTASGIYTDRVEVSGVSTTNATVSGLDLGTTYYFAATSYSSTQESDYSREVEHTPGTSQSSSSDSARGCVYSPNAGQGVTWLLLLLPLAILRGIRIIQRKWG